MVEDSEKAANPARNLDGKTAFVAHDREKHGIEPSPAEVRAATGLPRSMAVLLQAQTA